jgi:hypothetical protein
MTGHRSPGPEVRPASGRQLWRLNISGRLRLSEAEPEPITSAEAKTVIQAELAALGGSSLREPRRP